MKKFMSLALALCMTASMVITCAMGAQGDQGQGSALLAADAIDLSDAVVEVAYQDGAYAVTVTYGGAALTENRDYTLSYSIDASAYTTTITVTSLGDYCGSASCTVPFPGQQSALAHVSSEEELTEALNSGAGKIYFEADIQVDSPVEISDAVVFYGQGHTLSAGEALTTTASGTTDENKAAALLSVSETGALALDGLTLDGGGQVRCLYTAGTVEMADGAVLTGGGLNGTGTSERGLAAYIDETGSLTVTDGAIRDITDYVYVTPIVNLGTLTLEAGAYLTDLPSTYSAILNLGSLNWFGAQFDVDAGDGFYTNSSYSGTSAGTVIENQGTFYMTGGAICGYVLTNSGYSSTRTTAYFGAVHNAAGATFTMSGGSISGFGTLTTTGTNNSQYPSAGGGLSNNGTFTMSGGTISGNTSDCGGGVYNAGVFYLTGGTISNNSATFGGGVYNNCAEYVTSSTMVAAGEFIMTGGTISNNSLTTDTITTSITSGGREFQSPTASISAAGSALYVTGGSTAVISGGTIADSTTLTVTTTDADGNETAQAIGVGIVVAPSSNTEGGMTSGVFIATTATDSSLTVTGSPVIDTEILLVNLNTATLSARLNNLNADDFDGSDTSTYDYTITSTEATEVNLSSALALDGTLEATLSVATLDVDASVIDLTNLTSIAGYDIYTSISIVQMCLDTDGDILAVYDDRIAPNEADASLFTLSTGSGLYLTTDGDGNDAWAICAHSTLEYVEAEAATCTEAGHTEYYQCAGCGALFADENASTALTEEDITVAATGHTWALIPATEATATQTGLTAGVQCSVCGAWLIEQTVTAATGDTGDTGDSGDSSSTFLFDDVQDADEYYYDPVYWAYEQGITKGTSDTVFSPTQA
ncbi:MAG: S-layer homology domain-containing protein [Clostridiales bacterium]|nr:S-layer homology domain-containing protein [Clostridiales bacterium]